MKKCASSNITSALTRTEKYTSHVGNNQLSDTVKVKRGYRGSNDWLSFDRERFICPFY